MPFQYSEGTIQGSNARCVALLHTLKTDILEYETPEGKQFSRDLVFFPFIDAIRIKGLDRSGQKARPFIKEFQTVH